MGTYLQDNPPRQTQFRARRKAETGCIVMHTAESPADVKGPDTGTANVARFIETRTSYGSYHKLYDSDSRLQLVPWHLAAYGDGTGSNEFAVHISGAIQAAQWSKMSKEWRDGAIRQAAQSAVEYAVDFHRRTGKVIPARRITKAQSTKGWMGFISHGERDPGRRTDPGRDFPWTQFLAEYDKRLRAALAPEPGPVAPAKFVSFDLLLANIRNNPDIGDARARSDAKQASAIGEVCLFQEIGDASDWVAIRDTMPKGHKITAQVPATGNIQRHRELRGVTMTYDGDVFAMRKNGDKALLMPGFTGTVERSMTQPRAMRKLALDAKGTTLPTIVFIDFHMANGAFGSKPALATKPRRESWDRDWAKVKAEALHHLEHGRIVVLGGDGNRPTRDWPLIHKDQQWVIGGPSSTIIDGALVLCPPGITFNKRAAKTNTKVHSDHPQRYCRIRFTDNRTAAQRRAAK